MKYTIGSQVQEITSKAGKLYKKFNVKDEKGVITRDVVAFDFYSQFNDITDGAQVEAVLRESDYQGTKSYSLVDGNLGPKPAGMGGGAKMVAEKAKNIEKAMDRKEESIANFQDEKERSIMISGTARDATLILTALIANRNDQSSDWKGEWLKIRYWLVQNWQNTYQPKIAGTDIDYPQDDINVEDIPF